MRDSARTRKEIEERGLYTHLYKATKSDRPPEKIVTQQAKAAEYKNLYKNIQAMRETSLKKQQKSSGLGSYLGEVAKTAAKKTAPGLLVAAGLLLVYLFFFKKTEDEEIKVLDESPETTSDSETNMETSRYYYY